MASPNAILDPGKEHTLSLSYTESLRWFTKTVFGGPDSSESQSTEQEDISPSNTDSVDTSQKESTIGSPTRVGFYEDTAQQSIPLPSDEPVEILPAFSMMRTLNGPSAGSRFGAAGQRNKSGINSDVPSHESPKENLHTELRISQEETHQQEADLHDELAFDVTENFSAKDVSDAHIITENNDEQLESQPGKELAEPEGGKSSDQYLFFDGWDVSLPESSASKKLNRARPSS